MNADEIGSGAGKSQGPKDSQAASAMEDHAQSKVSCFALRQGLQAEQAHAWRGLDSGMPPGYGVCPDTDAFSTAASMVFDNEAAVNSMQTESPIHVFTKSPAIQRAGSFASRSAHELFRVATMTSCTGF